MMMVLEGMAMNYFDVLMFVPETGEFLDISKYNVHDVIDRKKNLIVGKIFVNKETGKEDYIQMRNGSVRRLP